VLATVVALVSFAGILPISYLSSDGHRSRPDSTSNLEGERSAGISYGNRDGTDHSRQRPKAAVNNQVLSYFLA
jgi:hypothetical protein